VTLWSGNESIVAKIKSLKSVTHVHLVYSWISDRTVECLTEMEQLQEIELIGSDHRFSRDLATKLAAMPQLRSLSLDGCPIGDDFLQNLINSKSLESISLADTNVSAKGLSVICERLPLKVLLFPGVAIDDSELRDFVVPMGIERVWAPVTAGDGFAVRISSADTLKKLDMQRSRLTDKGLAALAKCKALVALNALHTAVSLDRELEPGAFQRLETLNLWECPLKRDSLSNLGALNELRSLELLRYKLGEKDLALLGTLHKLRELDVGGYECINDDGVEALRNLKNLRSLHMNGAAITDKSLQTIKTFRQLEQLWLDGTAVTDVGIQSLSSLPVLKELSLNATGVSVAAAEKLLRAAGREFTIVPQHVPVRGSSKK
jgi:Leucine-rich repeat (LRR) protein